MECKVVFRSISRNWITQKWEIAFETGEDITKSVDSIREKELSLKAGAYRKRRSPDANAYYWKLLTKLAETVGISKNRAHNIMLSRYGQPEEIDGKFVYVVVPDTPSGEEKAMEAGTYHIRPTSEVKRSPDGTVFRTYRMIRGSGSYDSREMSVLINGLVTECRNAGIETMTPEQIDEMVRLYRENGAGK